MTRNVVRFLGQSLVAAVITLLLVVLASYFELPVVPEALGAISAAGQRRPPAATVGQSEELLRSLDLTGELESGKGRPLRMRRITMQPGGALALHNHRERPAVTYMLQGEMTYHQQGRPDVLVRPGGGFAEGRATTHWAENTGNVPAVWIAVDIPRP